MANSFKFLKLFMFGLSFLLGSLALANEKSIPFINELAECVDVGKVSLVERNDILFIEGSLSLLQSIGYCGCQSALASYSVVNGDYVIGYGTFVLKESRTMSFTISSDSKQKGDSSSVEFRLSCGG